jgi:hypothetical protein
VGNAVVESFLDLLENTIGLVNSPLVAWMTEGTSLLAALTSIRHFYHHEGVLDSLDRWLKGDIGLPDNTVRF